MDIYTTREIETASVMHIHVTPVQNGFKYVYFHNSFSLMILVLLFFLFVFYSHLSMLLSLLSHNGLQVRLRLIVNISTEARLRNKSHITNQYITEAQ